MWLLEAGWSEMTRDGYVVPADPQAVVAVKNKVQSSRSWILLDCTGQSTVLDVDKYAIMHRVQIHARDLRILDPLLSYPSTILGRERAIVLNLEVLMLFGLLGCWFLFSSSFWVVKYWFLVVCVFLGVYSISRRSLLPKRLVFFFFFFFF